MAKEFICGGEKYELGGPKLDSIGLAVALKGLPPTIEIEGYTLQVRTTFHVTLVAMGKIIERHQTSDPDFLKKVSADFCQFVQENPIDLVYYRDEFRFMAQNEKRSVVIMCDVSNLDKFFELLNKKYNLKLEYPPTHVTLYTLQPNTGIFMVDSSDKDQLSKIIPAPVKISN